MGIAGELATATPHPRGDGSAPKEVLRRKGREAIDHCLNERRTDPVVVNGINRVRLRIRDMKVAVALITFDKDGRPVERGAGLIETCIEKAFVPTSIPGLTKSDTLDLDFPVRAPHRTAAD